MTPAGTAQTATLFAYSDPPTPIKVNRLPHIRTAMITPRAIINP